MLRQACCQPFGCDERWRRLAAAFGVREQVWRELVHRIRLHDDVRDAGLDILLQCMRRIVCLIMFHRRLHTSRACRLKPRLHRGIRLHSFSMPVQTDTELQRVAEHRVLHALGGRWGHLLDPTSELGNVGLPDAELAGAVGKLLGHVNLRGQTSILISWQEQTTFA